MFGPHILYFRLCQNVHTQYQQFLLMKALRWCSYSIKWHFLGNFSPKRFSEHICQVPPRPGMVRKCCVYPHFERLKIKLFFILHLKVWRECKGEKINLTLFLTLRQLSSSVGLLLFLHFRVDFWMDVHGIFSKDINPLMDPLLPLPPLRWKHLRSCICTIQRRLRGEGCKQNIDGEEFDCHQESQTSRISRYVQGLIGTWSCP